MKTILIKYWDRFSPFSSRNRSRCKAFLQDNMIFFIFPLLYLFFLPFWEKLIGNHIVDSFLSYFKPCVFNDIVIIIMGIGCIMICYSNRGKKIKQETINICTLIIIFWVYYRFVSNRFDLTSLSLSGFIKYIDIVPLYAICKIIPLFFKNRTGISFKGGLIRDTPIDKEEKDELGRKGFAEDTVVKILETDTSDNSFVFGIDATWGAGKTSFMNMMKEFILSPGSKYRNCIIKDFNPWLFSTENDLVTAFLGDLSKTLKRYDRSLAKNVIDYSKILSAFETTETKIIASLVQLTKKEDSLMITKTKIIDAIKRLKKRIVVFIDDLDRLDADELMEMMKLIRTISEFPFVYFIVAYDKSYLVRCLKNKVDTIGTMDIKGTDFLEKIFQHEFHLPPISTETLRELLYSYIIKNTGLDQPEEGVIFSYIEGDNCSDIDYRLADSIELYLAIIYEENNPIDTLSNIREVKRLANHFTLSYDRIGGNIYVRDLLLFEFFKIKYPLVFAFFEKNKDKILLTGNDGKHYELYAGQDDYHHINFIRHLHQHSANFYITEMDLRSVTIILELLFSSNNPKEIGKHHYRINSIKCFDRYINLDLYASDIPEDEFQELFELDNSEIKDRIYDLVYDYSEGSLLDHLSSYKTQDKDKHKKLILSFLIYISTDESLGLVDLTNTTDSIIAHLKDFNKDKIFSDQDREFVVNALIECGYSDDICDYISHLHDQSQIPGLNLSNNDFNNIHQAIFKNCIENGWVFKVFRCFHTLIQQANDNSEFESCNKALIESMREYCEDDLIYIIPELISRDDNKFSLNDSPIIIWGSIEAFYNFIYDLDEINPIIIEFKDFLQKYKNNDYNSIPFTFKLINDEFSELQHCDSTNSETEEE